LQPFARCQTLETANPNFDTMRRYHDALSPSVFESSGPNARLCRRLAHLQAAQPSQEGQRLLSSLKPDLQRQGPKSSRRPWSICLEMGRPSAPLALHTALRKTNYWRLMAPGGRVEVRDRRKSPRRNRYDFSGNASSCEKRQRPNTCESRGNTPQSGRQTIKPFLVLVDKKHLGEFKCS